MRRREHIHHMALSPLIEQPLMTDGRNSLGVCIHTCVGASFFGLLHVAGGRGAARRHCVNACERSATFI